MNSYIVEAVWQLSIPTVKGGGKGSSYLELSETGEDSELHLLELEERMIECLCSCESLVRVSHQELTDLQRGWGRLC